MNKLRRAALFGLILLPLGKVVGAITGYGIMIVDPIGAAGVAALIMAAYMFSKPSGRQLRVIPYLVAANWLVFFFEGSLGALIITLICFFLSIIFVGLAKKDAWHIFMSLCLAFIMAAGTYFSFAFSGITENTVIHRADSIDKKYYAEVVDVDEGALGGSTVVRVCAYREVDLGFIKIGKVPERVYLGEWGEGESLKVIWTEEGKLQVNGKIVY